MGGRIFIRGRETASGATANSVFEIDLAAQHAIRDGLTVDLRPRTFAVLRYLIERPGQLVSKEALIAAVWPGLFVTDEVLTVCVSELRKALGDTSRTPKFIETVHRRGYRLIATVEPTLLVEASDCPFVGRSDDLARLEQHWQLAQRGERQVVFVTGEPGIGKTTLVDRFVGSVVGRCEREAGAAAWIARGQCVETFGSREAYLPVLEALTRSARDTDGARLIQLLREHAPSWLRQMPGLLSPDDGARLERECGTVAPDRMLRELVLALEALTREVPLILILEDLHWSDHSTIDLLAAVAYQRAPARLLIIGTYRPVDLILSGHRLRRAKQELDTKRLCSEIALELLSAAEVGNYLAARLRQSMLPPEVVELVHEQSDGNPLFLVTLTDHLLDDGLCPDVEILKGRIPQGLRPLIERQLEDCSEEERQVLEAASCLGVEFAAGLVAAALNVDPTNVISCCIDLVRRHVLRRMGTVHWPDGSTLQQFAFRHSMYRQLVHEGLDVRRRAVIHRRAGDRLEQAFAGREAEVAGALAGHFGEAGDAPRAAKYHHLAGRRALESCAFPEARSHLEAARQAFAASHSPGSEPDELQVLLALGPLLMATGGYSTPEVEAVCTRAQTLSERTGDYTGLASVLATLELARRSQGDLSTAGSAARRLLALADRTQDTQLLREAHHVMGCHRFWLGDLSGAHKHLESVVARVDGELPAFPNWSRHDPVVCSGAHLATVQWLMGYPERAVARGAAVVAACDRSPHPPSIALGLVIGAWVFVLSDAPGRVIELTDRAASLSQAHGFPVWDAIAKMLRGWAVARGGRDDEGAALLRSGLDAFWAVDPNGCAVDYQLLLSEVCLRQRRHAEAEELLVEAEAAQRRFGACYFLPELYRLRGESAANGAGDLARAVDWFERGAAVARQQQSRGLLLRLATSWARVLRDAGNPVRAREVLAPVVHGLYEGSETKEARAACALLEEVSAPSPLRALPRVVASSRRAL